MASVQSSSPRILQPLQQLGVSSFRLALFPEGEEMVAFNRGPTAYVSHFTSDAVWATGSSMAVLEEYITKIHPDDVSDMAVFVERHLKEAAGGGLAHRPVDQAASQFRAMGPDGAFRWYELRTHLYAVGGSALVIVEGCFLDISELKGREADLERKSRALQQEIDGHIQTRDSLQETLEQLRAVQARMLQQERLKALGEMVSGVAHDFGNLLTPIQMSAVQIAESIHALGDMLPSFESDDPLLEDLRASSEDIVTAARDGEELLKTLRATYRPGDNVQPKLTTVSIPAVLRAVQRLASARCASADHRVGVNLKLVASAQVYGSAGLLRQALLNLVLNGVDSMKEKKSDTFLQVHLSATVCGSEVVICVEDEGMGMSEAVLARCQDAFFSTKGQAGTGLGLANSSQTVAAMGGRLELSSTEGVGTRVCVVLPLHGDAAC